MYKTILLLAAAFSSVQASPQGTTATSGVALGEICDPKIPNVCAGGADCYAVNSMLIPRCGNFQATCTTDAQCAFNTCNAGFCNGQKTSSTTTTPPSTSSTETTTTHSPTTSNSATTTTHSTSTSSTSTTSSHPEPTGTNLPLGAECDPAVKQQCANGASCYAVNAMLIPRCGNFQAPCQSDAQCAYNKCVYGFCNGPLISSSTTISTSTTTRNGTTTTTTAASTTTTKAVTTTTTSKPINSTTTTTTDSSTSCTTTHGGYNTTTTSHSGPTHSIPTHSLPITTGTGPSSLIPIPSGSTNGTSVHTPTPSATQYVPNGAVAMNVGSGLVGLLVAIPMVFFL